MANWRQVQRLRRGVREWNWWRHKHPEVRVSLSDAHLSNADLLGADLHDADLYNADLSNTNLYGAKLSGAYLIGAHLACADLRSADLSRATLRGVNLRQINLNKANLTQADLRNVDLSGANLSEAVLCGTDLRGAIFQQTTLAYLDLCTIIGLGEIHHRGPCAIYLPSIVLPQGDTTLRFLRGIGLTDEQMAPWSSTMTPPIHYHSLFISYASKDEALASRLHTDLQANGVRCWFASEDLKIGNKVRQHTYEAIHQQDKLLLLLSKHSITSSWVENEVEAALEKEDRQKCEVLFPIRLDEVIMQTRQAWAATLRRTRHIGDFTQWTDPQAYNTAFERLLRDLKKADSE